MSSPGIRREPNVFNFVNIMQTSMGGGGLIYRCTLCRQYYADETSIFFRLVTAIILYE